MTPGARTERCEGVGCVCEQLVQPRHAKATTNMTGPNIHDPTIPTIGRPQHPYVVRGHTINLDASPEESEKAVDVLLRSGQPVAVAPALWVLCSKEFLEAQHERDDLRARVTGLEQELEHLRKIVSGSSRPPAGVGYGDPEEPT